MRLKFIGRDGSMGLKHGKVYEVKIKSDPKSNYIWASWRANIACPYGSLAAFTANWEDIKEEPT